MNTITSETSKKYKIFQVFKYAIYAFLCYNMFIFFQGELGASAHTFRDGIALGDLILAFSASIDSMAWIVLLLVFELETYILSDESLKGPLLWGLNILKAFCYIFILYAAYGYIARLMVLLNNSPFSIDDACTLIGTSYTYIEIDVYLQLHDKFTGRAYRVSQVTKPFLYFILFLAAIYWGFKGGFVDFWDAILWLLAFFFIELNIFQWHEETEEAHAKERMEHPVNE